MEKNYLLLKLEIIGLKKCIFDVEDVMVFRELLFKKDHSIAKITF